MPSARLARATTALAACQARQIEIQAETAAAVAELFDAIAEADTADRVNLATAAAMIGRSERHVSRWVAEDPTLGFRLPDGSYSIDRTRLQTAFAAFAAPKRVFAAP